MASSKVCPAKVDNHEFFPVAFWIFLVLVLYVANIFLLGLLIFRRVKPPDEAAPVGESVGLSFGAQVPPAMSITEETLSNDIPQEPEFAIFVSATGNKAHLDRTCSGMTDPKKIVVQKELVRVVDWCKNCAEHLRAKEKDKRGPQNQK